MLRLTPRGSASPGGRAVGRKGGEMAAPPAPEASRSGGNQEGLLDGGVCQCWFPWGQTHLNALMPGRSPGPGGTAGAVRALAGDAGGPCGPVCPGRQARTCRSSPATEGGGEKDQTKTASGQSARTRGRAAGLSSREDSAGHWLFTCSMARNRWSSRGSQKSKSQQMERSAVRTIFCVRVLTIMVTEK